mmetsp:Transcript_22017/g.61921  ORF Transcript_22017/g.61921 Transcript_22017/m.61921 type:complete len:98 (-) Transcript_22017:466-759(-)
MMTKENEIPLIVEGYNSPSLEFGLWWKQAGQRPPHVPRELCVEIIQHKFWSMSTRSSMPRYLLARNNVGDAVHNIWTIGKMTVKETIDFLFVFIYDE